MSMYLNNSDLSNVCMAYEFGLKILERCPSFYFAIDLLYSLSYSRPSVARILMTRVSRLFLTGS